MDDKGMNKDIVGYDTMDDIFLTSSASCLWGKAHAIFRKHIAQA